MITPKASILAIDSDPATLEMMEGVIGEQYDCELTGELAVAREKLMSDGFSVVLCDVQMPGEFGLALVEELTAESEATAIVPVAGTEDSSLVEHALELGVYGYLVKPFSPGQLLITIETALRRLEAEATARGHRRRLQETIQAAIDRAPIPIFVKDLEGSYLLANLFAHEVMRLEPGEMIGRSDTELMSPETERVVHAGDMQVMETEEPSFREMTVELLGRERTFLTVRFPYIGVDGNLAGLVGVSTEITAQREAEQLQRDLAGARARALEELQSSRQEALERMALAIEMHDSDVGRHVNRMARVTSYLASQLGLSDEEIQLIRAAAPMHDVGKVATPAEILRKPGPLTPEERVEMERHTEIGHRILSGSESTLLQMAARIALTHHERFDGSGYPQGLEGEEIPIEGRIVAVADVFDALLSDRPYRPACGIEEAVAVIREGRGVQFDPEVADVLLANSEAVVELRS